MHWNFFFIYWMCQTSPRGVSKVQYYYKGLLWFNVASEKEPVVIQAIAIADMYFSGAVLANSGWFQGGGQYQNFIFKLKFYVIIQFFSNKDLKSELVKDKST